MTSASKLWRLQAHDAAAIDRLARALKCPPLLAQLLINRGLNDPEGARRFVHAPLTGLHEPELLPGMPQAVDRIMSAVTAKRRICIYGDYDVDGVTGTAILLTLLRMLGAVVEFHIPHRIDEGYGLNSETLRRLAQEGVAQVITVDCGIASIAEADEAKRLGLELIVTDHHEPRTRLPEAAVLVHPRIARFVGGREYPFGGLSGAGVALKLAWALCKRACGSAKVTPEYREFLLDSVVLASLGTVADVVPLQDENRILVRHGLNRLRKSPSLGLRAILQSAGLFEKRELVSMDIGFGLGPRLNAAGRMGHARVAVELLTTASAQLAQDLARHLEDQNRRRQSVERQILEEARSLAEACNGDPALVLAKVDWHPGLIGIVASRLVEQFGRPVLMIAHNELEPCQGSGRSIPGFKLHEALNECTEDLLSHGGHAAAAGFRITAGAIDAFRQRFCAVARRHFGDQPPQRCLSIDAEIPLHALTSNVMQGLACLEPFGAYNPQPLFLAGNLQIVGQPRKVGGGERHLSMQVRQEGKYLRAVGFGMAERVDELMSAGGQCCMVFTPRFNEWQGFKRIELEIVDFQSGAVARL
jgi:single-stranded-DNA-specific exonuclease